MSKFIVAILLLTAVGAVAQGTGSGGASKPADKAPASSGIKLSGVTGTVLIKTAGGTMTVKAGEPVPEIPSGAEIVVESGEANVAVGGTTIKAGAGDSFTVTNTGTGGASIAVTGGVVAVVDASGKSTDIPKGEGTTVSLVAAPVTTTQTPTPTETKTETKTEESIPADSTETSGTTTTTQSSPTQESATTTSSTCVATVSPSSPCP